MHETASAYADPAEIARFNALAARWWDPEGPMKPLHRLNPVRIGFLRREFSVHFGREPRAMRPFEGLSLLDIGCGAGLVAEPMARQGFAVTGIDLAQDNIAAARVHAEEAGLAISYSARPLESLGAEQTFDAITLLEVVEHVPEMPRFVAEAAEHLRPGGLMIASTLNRTLKAFALAIVGAEYLLGWLERGTHDWNRFVTPDELETAFDAAGLVPETRAGMVFDPLANTWRLAPDCAVNYLMTARKPD